MSVEGDGGARWREQGVGEWARVRPQLYVSLFGAVCTLTENCAELQPTFLRRCVRFLFSLHAILTNNCFKVDARSNLMITTTTPTLRVHGFAYVA